MEENIYDKNLKLLANHEIPDDWSISGSEFDKMIVSTLFREIVINLSGFVYLSKRWIEPLVNWIGNRKCLEIMAGCGSLSKALQDYGVDIIATDIKHSDYHVGRNWDTNEWTDIEELSAEDALDKYGKDIDIVIMSWAPYDTPDAYNALKKMHDVNPNCIMIYIGEPQGGCTADNSFFENAIKIKDGEFYQKVANMYQPEYGIHDKPYLVKYKSKGIE